MRIISGSAGRRVIRVPKDVTRPTTDFVRQAVFSIIHAKVEGAKVLDLFAGSGALGLESLSRGASSCVFVDSHRNSESVLKENLQTCRLDGGRVVKADVHTWLKREHGQYDIIFADPPYAHSAIDRDHLSELIHKDQLGDRLADDGLILFEQPAGKPPLAFPGMDLILERTYGSSGILLYAKGSDS